MKRKREPASVRANLYSKTINGEELVQRYLEELKEAEIFTSYYAVAVSGDESVLPIYKFYLHFNPKENRADYELVYRIYRPDAAKLYWNDMGSNEWDRATFIPFEEILETAPEYLQSELIFHFNLFR